MLDKCCVIVLLLSRDKMVSNDLKSTSVVFRNE